MSKNINWGIIGCGDVTEVKSGPAFNKVAGSTLVAVMRRNAAKAKDYAARHGVPAWYDDADALINDSAVNAIYIATPPSSHLQYALAAIKAGKPVYVEKPMALNAAEAEQMAAAAATNSVRLVVAHYRRQWPLFLKLKQLLQDKLIGEPRFVQLSFYKRPISATDLLLDKNAWRVNPVISGGGFFHDLAPHQLDILYYLFGAANKVQGIATNQAGDYAAADLVSGNILFKSGIAFSGTWCFSAGADVDRCEIIGTKGKLAFSFFCQQPIEIDCGATVDHLEFTPLEHVQQPMINATVRYFLNEGPNPCSAQEGAEIMRWIDAFTR